jgi:hypothetical protein
MSWVVKVTLRALYPRERRPVPTKPVTIFYADYAIPTHELPNSDANQNMDHVKSDKITSASDLPSSEPQPHRVQHI